jgi:hypothetical protein
MKLMYFYYTFIYITNIYHKNEIYLFYKNQKKKIFYLYHYLCVLLIMIVNLKHILISLITS